MQGYSTVRLVVECCDRKQRGSLYTNLMTLRSQVTHIYIQYFLCVEKRAAMNDNFLPCVRDGWSLLL
jgi:hypothetical protein